MANLKAFITGSTSGIGKQIGIDLLNSNYFVYFHGTSVEKSNKIKSMLTDNTNYNIIISDLNNNIEYINKHIKNIDILILNAGITDRTPFGLITKDNWDKVLNINFTNQFFLIQALKDKINKNGRIIFISSILSKIPRGSSISYAVSKSAINTVVPYLAKEFASKNITVNSICPGFIEDTNWHDGKSTEQIDRIKKQILLKRFGKTKEVSSLVQEIIKNQYINGSIINITGGYGI